MLKTIPISQIKIGTRHRKDMGDLTGLAHSILKEGLLQPIGVTQDLELVFGERRLRAHKDILKKKTILARIVDVRSIIAGEYAENEIRKDFTASERVAIAKAIERQFPERRGNPSIRQKIDELDGRTDDHASKKAGFGNRQTFRQAAKVVQNGTAKLIHAMDSGRVSISAASILSDVDADEQESVLQLDEKAILQAAKEIRLRKGLDTGIGGHERPFRGATNDWLTPPHILKSLGKFDLDPCASLHQSKKTAKRQFTINDDGLSQDWFGRVWLNPPYGDQTEKWLAKMAKHQNGIVLIYARTDTTMFFDHVWNAANGIFFLRGRLSFINPNKLDNAADAPSGAPSVLISYDKKGERTNQSILKACKLKGKFLEIK